MESKVTSKILTSWFEAIGKGDLATVLNTLSEDIEFELPQNEYNSVIPYLGKHRGRQEVANAFKIRNEGIEVLDYGVRQITAQDNRASAVVFTRATQRRTLQTFEIEDAHNFELNDQGQISRWKVYFDPNTEVAAYRADFGTRLLAAVRGGSAGNVHELLSLGASPNVRDSTTGMTCLMFAACQGNAEMVRMLLDGGADLFAVDSLAGASVLHKACQGGSLEVVRLLVEKGAFVDWIAPTTGHTPLMDAIWFKWPAIVEYLLNKNAGLGITTHYGFTLQEHLEYEEGVTETAKQSIEQIKGLVQARQEADEEGQKSQKLIAAVTSKYLCAVTELLAAGAAVDQRFPVLNGFNDLHTPLLVACRDGLISIAKALLQAGADVNAVEPTFGAVPLHKAVYNGHADIVRLLVAHPEIKLDFQGYTNGYTPLHDALWHGFADCSEILIAAGAKVNLLGHDGKAPLDLARETLGADHAVYKLIESKLKES